MANPEFKKPLNRFYLGKQQLLGFGFEVKDIDRLYRSLFVHSMGFLQKVQEVGHKLYTNPVKEIKGKSDFI